MIDPPNPDTAPMLAHALWAAANLPGARVFPVKPGAKFPPLVKDWPSCATADAAQIEAWWSKWPRANIGITGILAVDIDVRDGKPGLESFQNLGLTKEEKASALIVKTASGAWHACWSLPEGEEIASRNNWRPGIDIKSTGGYVLGAGSRRDGFPEPYEVGHYQGSLAACPKRLVEMLRAMPARDKRKDRDAIAAGAEVDDPDMVLSAISWLDNEAPAAIEGSGGDDATFKVAAQLRDWGLSEDRAFELMADHYNPRCAPPWDLDELQAKVGNAYRYAQNPAGAKHPEAIAAAAAAEFEEVAIDRPKCRWWFRHGDPVSHAMRWLLYDRLPLVGTALVVGPSGSGKSFFCADLARCVATGSDFFGVTPDERGGVAYFPAEGVAGTQGRLSVLGDPGLAIWAEPVSSLRSKAEQSRIADLLEFANRDCLAQHGFPLRVIMFDTLAASGLLEDENSNSECAEAVKFLERLAIRFACVVLVTHHPPKNGSGARGGSALHAGFDTVVEIRQDGGPVRQVDCTKGRDAPTGRWGAFTLIPQTIGFDAKGREITTCTLSAAAGRIADSALTLSPELTDAILSEVGDREWRKDPQCKDDSIYAPIGRATGLNSESRDGRRTIGAYLNAGLRAGILFEATGRDGHRKPVQVIAAQKPLG